MDSANFMNRTESTKVSSNRTKSMERAALLTQRQMFNTRVYGRTTRRTDKAS